MIELNTNYLISKRSELMKKLFEYEEIKKDIDAIDRVLKLNGIKLNDNESNKSMVIIENTPIIPDKYSDALTWESKCLFILKEHGSLSANDVAKKIIELQPEIELKTAEQRCTFNLSKLKRDGIINVVGKDGKKFKYSL